MATSSGKLPAQPYLEHSARLGDVVGAIQVLGSAPWHAIRKDHWERFLGRAHSTPDGAWQAVFEEHPEVFRLEPNGDIALRWRFAYVRNFDPWKHIEYTPEQREALSEKEKAELHRKPLTADQISALMNIVVELHARALAQAQESRWWIPIASSFAGGLLGATLGFFGAIGAAYIKESGNLLPPESVAYIDAASEFSSSRRDVGGVAAVHRLGADRICRPMAQG